MKLSKRILDGNEGIVVAYIFKLEQHEIKGKGKFLLIDAYTDFNGAQRINFNDILKDRRKGDITLYHIFDTAQQAIDFFTMKTVYDNTENCIIALRAELDKIESLKFTVNSLKSNLSTIVNILAYYQNIKVEDIGGATGLLGL